MKYFKHVMGFILIALGIVLVIHAKLGASPMDAFNVFLYTLLMENGITITLGTIIFIIGTLATIFTYILTKDKSLIISYAFLLLLSVVVDGWNALFGLIPDAIITHLAYRIISAIFAFLLMCYGVSLTLTSGLPTMPYERLLLHIDKNINNISISKIFIDGTFFTLAVILGIYLNRLFEQVSIMTFVIAFFTGIVVKNIIKLMNHKNQKGVVVHEIE